MATTYKPGKNLPARLQQALESLPIFPLPDVVLLPGAMLPLHIFEPRYRAMTASVLGSGGLVAMAMLKPGSPGSPEQPAIFPTVGVGEVVAHEKLPDGCYNLLLRGVTRAAVTEELPGSDGFRIVRARALRDVGPGPGQLEAEARELVLLCDRLSWLIPDGGERLRALARSEQEPSVLVDVLGASLVADPAARLNLLEELDVSRRVDRVVGELAGLIAQFAPPGGMQN